MSDCTWFTGIEKATEYTPLQSFSSILLTKELKYNTTRHIEYQLRKHAVGGDSPSRPPSFLGVEPKALF